MDAPAPGPKGRLGRPARRRGPPRALAAGRRPRPDGHVRRPAAPAHRAPGRLGDRGRSPSHVPVLLDRVVALLAPALDARRRGRWWTRPSGWAATPRRCSSAARRPALVGVDRDPEALRARRRAAGAVRATASPSCTRCTTSSPRRARRARARARRRRAVRPRRLLDAARRARTAASPTPQDAPLDMRMDQTPGHHRGRRPQHLPGRRAGPDPAGVRRGEVRPPDRRRRRAGARDASRSPTRRGSSSWSAPSIPAAGPAHRRAPGQAHLPGAADRGQRRARRAAAGDPRADRRAGGRRARRGDDLPLARGPDRQASLRAGAAAPLPATCRSCPEAHSRALRLLTRGAERADAREIAPNPRAASVRLRAAERVRDAA